MKQPIPLLVPDAPSPQALLPYLQRMHEKRHYSNFGPLVHELESALLGRFVEQAGAPLALTTVASATLGLELVLTALGLAPGSRVLLPGLTFVATATAVLRAGHVPVLADVDIDSWLLTPDIARAVLRDTPFEAVMPVASFGAPHDTADWSAFQRETGIPVVIDAAGGFGSQWLAESGGTAVFSMHATKSLVAGEGGFVVSSDRALVAQVRELSNFGINLDTTADVPIGSLAGIGTNAKLSEYHAAVGLASLETWDAHAALRRAQYRVYREELSAAAGGQLRWQAVGGELTPSLLCMRLPDEAGRAALELLCARRAISTRRWYQPLLNAMHTLAPRCLALPAPQAAALSQTLVGLPFFLDMREDQRAQVVRAVRDATGTA